MSDQPDTETEPTEGAEGAEGEALLGTAYPEDADEQLPLEDAADPEPAAEPEPEATVEAEPAEDPEPATEAQADPSPRGLLQRGHRGAEVEALQHALVAAGHAVPTDGVYGPSTARAVRAYQAAQGFAPTGTVGTATAEALGL